LESHEIAELAGWFFSLSLSLSLSTVIFKFKKEFLFVAKVAIIPERRI
jgi:hypothetical protein